MPTQKITLKQFTKALTQTALSHDTNALRAALNAGAAEIAQQQLARKDNALLAVLPSGFTGRFARVWEASQQKNPRRTFPLCRLPAKRRHRRQPRRTAHRPVRSHRRNQRPRATPKKQIPPRLLAPRLRRTHHPKPPKRFRTRTGAAV